MGVPLGLVGGGGFIRDICMRRLRVPSPMFGSAELGNDFWGVRVGSGSLKA